MANVSYDTLTIEIQADSKQAKTSISNLSNSLQKLEKVAQNLDMNALKNAQKLLQDIAKIDFSNVSQGLQDVVMAFKTMQQAKGKNPQEALRQNFIAGMGINRYTDFSNVKFVNSDKLETINDTAKKATKSVNNLSKSIKKLDSATKKASGSFEKIAKAFKRIAFYRIVRKAIQLIAQELTKSIESLAQFDSDFNKSISEIKSSFSYLGRSILAFVVPLIKLVSPFITFITDALGDLTNELGELLSSLVGQDVFSGAKKNAEDFAESLKKAKNTALGIDELNVLQQDNQDDNWYSANIQATSGLADVIAKLKDEWQPIISGISDVIKALKPALEVIRDLIHDLIYDTSSEVNGSINSCVNAIEHLAGLISTILVSLKPLLNLLNKLNSILLNQINSVLDGIFGILAPLFDIIGTILSPILSVIADYISFIAQPLVLIGDILTALIQAIFGTWKNIFVSIFLILKSITDYFTTGKFDTSIFEAIGKGFESTWHNFAYMFAEAIDNFVRAILGGIDAIGNFFGQDWGLVDNYGGGWVSRLEDSGFLPSASGRGAELADKLGNTEKSSNLPSQSIKVYLDSREIANRVIKVNDNRGARQYFGGTLTYGK